MSPLSRRALLTGGLAAAVTAGVGLPFGLGLAGSTSTGTLLPSRLPRPRPFTAPLTVPPVLSPTPGPAGDHYEIVASTARVSIVPGTTTPVFGYQGTFPGPTIISRQGRPVSVTYRNRLPVPMVVHLHGGHTPHHSDGHPTDLIHPEGAIPGATPDMPGGERMRRAMAAGDVTWGERTYRYPMRQRAATLWYHDHRMDFTGPAVWRGLAGFHLVRDAEEDALALPAGPFELPLMITDRSFDTDGSFLYPSIDPTLTTTPGVTDPYVPGVLGDVMLVNGTPWPRATVHRTTYRLRILNACNARRLDLRLHPPPEGGIVQIGTDGGLLARPVTHTHVELAPAQRLDALVDFSRYPAGTRITLHNDFGGGDTGLLVQFVTTGEHRAAHRVPDRLSTPDDLDTARATVVRSFRFRTGAVDHRAGWIIGDAPFSPTTAVARPRLGDVEIWELFADFHHPVHVHLDPFRIIGRGIGGPGPYDAGWKDTIDLRPAEQARIAVRFTDYTGRFVFHCHNLEHEDMAMMATFETTR